jgi:hypothetical protein
MKKLFPSLAVATAATLALAIFVPATNAAATARLGNNFFIFFKLKLVS